MAATDTPKFQFWRFFFLLKGRVSRGGYALSVLPITIGMFLVGAVLRANAPHIAVKTLLSINMITAFAQLLFLWPKFALSAKRLHDFGWSGTFAVMHFTPFVAGFVYGLGLVMIRSGHAAFDITPFRLITNITVWSVWAGVFILCLIPGTKGPNRYGTPPRGPQTYAADAF